MLAFHFVVFLLIIFGAAAPVALAYVYRPIGISKSFLEQPCRLPKTLNHVQSQLIPLQYSPTSENLESFVASLNWRYFVAGAFGASISHVVAVPLDVVKTKIQVDSDSSLGPVEIVRDIISGGELKKLFSGLVPTLLGYFVQGGLKYGFYELFKSNFFQIVAVDHLPVDNIVIFMVSGALAEFIGSTFLTPFEAIRIRMVANPNFSKGIIDCSLKMITSDGLISFFRGLPASWLKNIPYTVVQLSTFEVTTNMIYSKLSDLGFSNGQTTQYQFLITFVSACLAGLLASLASQPGDTLLSMVNKAATRKDISISPEPSISITDIVSQLGVRGLYKGAKTRLLHVTVIVVVQLLVYDFIKTLCGIPVTGSH